MRVLTDAHYAKSDYADLAQEILTNLKYQRKTVLICWDHEYIPRLAAALGVYPEPPPWPENVFDRVWIITYRGGPGQPGESAPATAVWGFGGVGHPTPEI